MKKASPENRLAALTPEQRWIVFGWFQERLDYEKIAARCQERFGFKTTRKAMRKYFRNHGVIFAVAQAVDAVADRGQGVEMLFRCLEPGKATVEIRALTPESALSTAP